MNAQIPPLPKHLALGLTDPEYERVLAQYPKLPRSLDGCPTCRGQKTFQWWNDERTEVVTYDCPCIDQYLAERYLLHCGLHEHLLTVNWTDLDLGIYGSRIDPLLAYLDERDVWWDHRRGGRGLLLSGPPGVGKTTLATLVLKSYLGEHRWGGYFSTFLSMMDLFSAGWRDDAQRQWFDRYVRHAGLLVIDDPGKEQDTRNEMATSMLDNLLRERLLGGAPVVITTNDTDAAVNQRYGRYVASMLTEAVTVVDLAGVGDQRPKTAERTIEQARLGLDAPILFQPPPVAAKQA